MIRLLRQWRARKRLQRMVAKARNSFEIRDYAKRREAMLRYTRGVV